MNPIVFWKQKIINAVNSTLQITDWTLMDNLIDEIMESNNTEQNAADKAFKELYFQERDTLTEGQQSILFCFYTNYLISGRLPLYELAPVLDVYFKKHPQLHEENEEFFTYLIEWLQGYVNFRLQGVYTRKIYTEVADFLVSLYAMGDVGKTICFNLHDYIVNRYHRRKVLMEELEGAGEFLGDLYAEGSESSTLDPFQLSLEELLENFYTSGNELLIPHIITETLMGTFFVPVSSPVIKPGKNSKWKYPKPGILFTVEDEELIPLFTSMDKITPDFLTDMGYETVKMPFTEVLKRVWEDPTLKYPIILNPFTDPFMLDEVLMKILMEELGRPEFPKIFREEDRPLESENKVSLLSKSPGEVPKEETQEETVPDNVIHLSDYLK